MTCAAQHLTTAVQTRCRIADQPPCAVVDQPSIHPVELTAVMSSVHSGCLAASCAVGVGGSNGDVVGETKNEKSSNETQATRNKQTVHSEIPAELRGQLALAPPRLV